MISGDKYRTAGKKYCQLAGRTVLVRERVRCVPSTINPEDDCRLETGKEVLQEAK